MQTQETVGERVSTGVDGVDSILHGGFVPRRTYMVRGDPGTGKSLLGLHFLLSGANEGEDVLYINLEERTSDRTPIRSGSVLRRLRSSISARTRISSRRTSRMISSVLMK